MKRTRIIALILLGWTGLYAQAPISLDVAITAALKNHPQLLAAQKELEEQSALNKGSFSLPDPQLMLAAPTGEFFTPGIQQGIDNPFVYIQQAKVGKQQVTLAETGLLLSRSAVIRQVSDAYNELQYAEAGIGQSRTQDSIFNALHLATEKRFSAGDAGLLEKTSSEAKAKEAAVKLAQAEAELKNAQLAVMLLTGLDTDTNMVTVTFEKMALIGGSTEIPVSGPFFDFASQNADLARQQWKLAKSKIAPGYSFGYMNQGEQGSSMPHRFQFGMTVPLWFWTHNSRIKAAKANAEKTSFESASALQHFSVAWIDAMSSYQKNLASLDYYESTGIQQSEIILDAATRSHTAGEVSYLEYMYSISQALDIKSNYYEALKDYNTSVIELNYLKGN